MAQQLSVLIRKFLSLPSATALFALSAVGATAPKEEALKLSELTQELAPYQTINRLDASFTSNKTLKDVGIEVKSEGKVRIERPNRVEWKVLRPSPLSLKLEGENVQIESGQGADHQTQTYNLKQVGGDKATQGLTALISWLNLDAKVIFSLYETYRIGPSRFLFRARDPKASPFLSMEAQLDPKGHMKDLVIEEASGDRMKIVFSHPVIKRASAK